ncbi:TonB-dependent receptor [Compostibacter hankyongensis]|uniref:TonB-dependent receptor n=2 Tax=Compostibacter hankyongensis TaxID=1007089 RepID=A0ABP8G4F7_9BACT
MLEIRLQPALNTLDETVVMAYGTTTRRLNTGSISRITAEEIGKQPVTNVLAALSGRMPGVFVQTTNGLPGGNIKIQVRGRGSIAAGTDPLYIIDGVPVTSTPLNSLASNFQNINGLVSPLNSITPDNIESIEILKDADATAIYGSRGANGVVLITTKKGTSGKTEGHVNVYYGFNKSVRLPQMLGLNDYLQLRKEAYVNDNKEPSPADAPDLLVWDQRHYTDWGRYLLGGTGRVINTEVTLSGGSMNTHFRLGLSYRREGTILPGDQRYDRGSGYFNLDHSSANKKFSVQLSSRYSSDKNNLIKSIDFAGLYGLPPNYPIYNKDGSYNWTLTNPVAWLGQESKSKTENFIANGVFRYTLIKGLDLKTSIGYTKINMDMFSSLPASTQNPAFSPVSSANFGNNYNETYLVEPQIEYRRSVGKSKFSVLLGGTWQKVTTEGYYIFATDYTNEELLESLAAAGTISAKGSSYSEYKYASMFGRINVVNRQKYLLNMTFRRDGSSKFGPGRQFGNFGAVGVGWIFSEEPFFKNRLPFLSFGKLRGSYGITGNDQISNYQYLSSYKNGNVYQGIATLRPSILANDAFGWETTKKLESALELNFLKDRIALTAAYFYNRSGNQLIAYKIPYISGPFGSYQANFPGVVQNTGWELSLNTENITGQAITWQTSFNITFPHNKLISFPGLAQSSYANTYEVGEDLSIVKGYRFLGIDAGTGVARFQDIDKDGSLTYGLDYVVIGKTSPDIFGGLQNSLSLGSFSIDLFFQFVKQQSRINPRLYSIASQSNVLQYGLNRWKEPGDITNVQKPTATYGTPAFAAMQNLTNSSAGLIDGSYIRCKNVSLRYLISKPLLKKLHLKQAMIYLQMQNIFTLSDPEFSGLDPETVNGISASVPQMKSYVLGIQLSF